MRLIELTCAVHASVSLCRTADHMTVNWRVPRVRCASVMRAKGLPGILGKFSSSLPNCSYPLPSIQQPGALPARKLHAATSPRAIWQNCAISYGSTRSRVCSLYRAVRSVYATSRNSPGLASARHVCMFLSRHKHANADPSVRDKGTGERTDVGRSSSRARSSFPSTRGVDLTAQERD